MEVELVWEPYWTLSGWIRGSAPFRALTPLRFLETAGGIEYNNIKVAWSRRVGVSVGEWKHQVTAVIRVGQAEGVTEFVSRDAREDDGGKTFLAPDRA